MFSTVGSTMGIVGADEGGGRSRAKLIARICRVGSVSVHVFGTCPASAAVTRVATERRRVWPIRKSRGDNIKHFQVRMLSFLRVPGTTKGIQRAHNPSNSARDTSVHIGGMIHIVHNCLLLALTQLAEVSFNVRARQKSCSFVRRQNRWPCRSGAHPPQHTHEESACFLPPPFCPSSCL